MKAKQQPFIPTMTLEELLAHQQSVVAVQIGDAIYETLAQIRQELLDEGIRPSDRRFKQSLSLLQASAYLKGRNDEVSVGDLRILANSLWESAEQQGITKDIVKKHSQDAVQSFMDRVNDEFMEILQLATSAMNGERSQDQVSELLLKGKALSSEVQQFQEKHPSRSELVQLKARMQEELLKLTSAVIGF